MKKIILALLTICLIFSMVSCMTDGNGGQTDTGGAPTDPTNAQDVVLFGGADDYRIVYSSSATNAVKDLIVQMSESVKAVTGEAPRYVADNARNDEEVAREILIASTNRSASNENAEKITGIGYRIAFIGEKLVITASNDTVLRQAMDALLAAWTATDGRVVLSSATVLDADMTESMMPLYENGSFRYKIVLQAGAAKAVQDSASSLSGRLSSLTGKKIDVTYDSMSAESEGVYEICIGRTNRQISQGLYGELGNSFEYKIKTEGTRIAVGANSTDAMKQAVSTLADDLCTVISSTYCGTPAVAKDYGKGGSITETLSDFPEPQVGTPKGMQLISEDGYVMYYDGIAESDYQGYVTTLGESGCTVKNTYALGGNRYTLMTHEKYSVYVAYLARVGDMRIILGKPDELQPEPAAPVTDTVCEPTLWQLKIDAKGGDNGGMSYVMQLTDGTFVVIDGGYKTKTEADNLYNLLKENTVGGGEPVISAWIITHLHIDHYGCLNTFSQYYSDLVEVKAFYYNFPGVLCGDIGPGNANNVENLMKRWSNAKCYGKLHSGMSFSVVDARFTVICTYEDVYPSAIENGNDTTTVFKVELGGQSIMFLGDAYYKESAVMSSQIDASVLKSDIVQVSHHGYEGCSETLYRIINAPVVLWPMPIVGYNSSGNPKPVFMEWYQHTMNSYLRESSDIKKIIVSGAGTEKLELPYTPTGDRIVDYNAYYNANKNNE